MSYPPQPEHRPARDMRDDYRHEEPPEDLDAPTRAEAEADAKEWRP